MARCASRGQPAVATFLLEIVENHWKSFGWEIKPRLWAKKGTAQVRPSDLTRSLSNIHDRVCSPVDELSSSTSGLGRRNQFITWVISLRTGRLWIQCLNQSLWDQSLIRRSRRTCADLEHLIRFIGLGATCTDGALGNESQKCGLCVTTHGGHSVSYQLEFCQTFFLPICKTSHTTKHWVRRF